VGPPKHFKDKPIPRAGSLITTLNTSTFMPVSAIPQPSLFLYLSFFISLSPCITDFLQMGNMDYECPHRVAIPPSKPLAKSLETSLKETFFPDDPLRQFKNQPLSRKFMLALQYFVPILEWAPRYTFDFFKSDVIAGITIASLAVPQGISYANLANLPPIIGLCKCMHVSTQAYIYIFI
jgi:hypothetical protein